MEKKRIAIDAICMRSRERSYDIVCHGIDLKARTQFHYGKLQKKRDHCVDPSLLFGIQSLASDLRRRSPGDRQAVSPSESRQVETFAELIRAS
jgi:hypothetical protein